MPRTCPRLALLVLALIGAALSTPLAQQTEAPPSQDQIPTFRVEANFVRVDAYPTRDGQAVRDLRPEEFEVYEDGVLQAIETFEHIEIAPAGPQAARIEPRTRSESEQLAANPRNRVFVLFLDVPHVSVDGSYHINEPLVSTLHQIIGPDDLVGVMTPEMSASNLTLGRRTEVLEDALRRNWAWGGRHRIGTLDQDERRYEQCFPLLPEEGNRQRSELAQKMIDRRRERRTLESFEDLVRYLRAVREERKAVITITEGWLLYRPDSDMTRLRSSPALKWEEAPPGRPEIHVGPGGTLTARDTRNPDGGSLYDCNADRMQLSMMDNERYFRDILEIANRGNTSFYPIDPRGLPVFDTPMGPDRPPSGAADMAMLRARHTAMRTLAEVTDGLAVINSNDLHKGLRRIVDDLTSYYLLGYYSTNGKLDGRYRTLRVRVTRPGVNVRARRGYRAASAEEITAAREAAAAPGPGPASAVTAAFGSLSRIRPAAGLAVNAAPVTDPSTGLVSAVWVAGEILVGSGRSGDWTGGATADVEVSAGGASERRQITLRPGERTFLAPIALSPPAGGSIDVRVRLTGGGAEGVPYSEVLRLDGGDGSRQPLLFRRGVTTGNRYQPAANFSFSRTERLRLDLPISGHAAPDEARVLDRNGEPLNLPVTLGNRTDEETGQRWVTAEVTLAPLGPGDYAIEVATGGAAAGQQRVITAIRVTR